MKKPKIILLTLSVVLLLTACSQDTGGGTSGSGGAGGAVTSGVTSAVTSGVTSAAADDDSSIVVSNPSDMPEGDSAFEVQWVGMESGSVYVSGFSGNYSYDSGFIASGDLGYMFKLNSDTFTGEFWEPGAAGLTSRTRYSGAIDFYSGYYTQAEKLDVFYPTACNYEFDENGELTYLVECADLTYVAPEPESDGYEVTYYFDYSFGMSGSSNYWNEFGTFSADELSDTAIIEEMSELTGLDFFATTSLVDGRYTIDWSPESSLIKGLDGREHKVDFAVSDNDTLRWFMMDSLAWTLRENVGMEDIYYTMDGGKELCIDDLYPVNVIPASMPYKGSAYYFAEGNGGVENSVAISEEEALDILSDAIGMAEGTAIISYGQEVINGEPCWTFAYGTNTPEKFTAEEHFAVTGNGTILKMSFAMDGQYVEYGGN